MARISQAAEQCRTRAWEPLSGSLGHPGTAGNARTLRHTKTPQIIAQPWRSRETFGWKCPRDGGCTAGARVFAGVPFSLSVCEASPCFLNRIRVVRARPKKQMPHGIKMGLAMGCGVEIPVENLGRPKLFQKTRLQPTGLTALSVAASGLWGNGIRLAT